MVKFYVYQIDECHYRKCVSSQPCFIHFSGQRQVYGVLLSFMNKSASINRGGFYSFCGVFTLSYGSSYRQKMLWLISYLQVDGLEELINAPLHLCICCLEVKELLLSCAGNKFSVSITISLSKWKINWGVQVPLK